MKPPEARKYLFDMAEACGLIETFLSGKSFDDYRHDPLPRSGIERQFEIRRIEPVDSVYFDQGVLIRLHERTMFAISEADLDVVAGETLESRAEEAIANLEKAIEDLYQYDTGFTPPLTYGPTRRVGARGACVMTVDLGAKEQRPVGPWIDLR